MNFNFRGLWHYTLYIIVIKSENIITTVVFL